MIFYTYIQELNKRYNHLCAKAQKERYVLCLIGAREKFLECKGVYKTPER